MAQTLTPDVSISAVLKRIAGNSMTTRAITWFRRDGDIEDKVTRFRPGQTSKKPAMAGFLN
ncbi:MAG: hypothetical protein DHS20C01_02840 [marine bacterium B5-7]|nr:MAG: hypothetical protein DHS20C01_02840 [marine bacterium B5-7]